MTLLDIWQDESNTWVAQVLDNSGTSLFEGDLKDVSDATLLDCDSVWYKPLRNTVGIVLVQGFVGFPRFPAQAVQIDAKAFAQLTGRTLPERSLTIP